MPSYPNTRSFAKRNLMRLLTLKKKCRNCYVRLEMMHITPTPSTSDVSTPRRSSRRQPLIALRQQALFSGRKLFLSPRVEYSSGSKSTTGSVFSPENEDCGEASSPIAHFSRDQNRRKSSSSTTHFSNPIYTPRSDTISNRNCGCTCGKCCHVECHNSPQSSLSGSPTVIIIRSQRANSQGSSPTRNSPRFPHFFTPEESTSDYLDYTNPYSDSPVRNITFVTDEDYNQATLSLKLEAEAEVTGYYCTGPEISEKEMIDTLTNIKQEPEDEV